VVCADDEVRVRLVVADGLYAEKEENPYAAVAYLSALVYSPVLTLTLLRLLRVLSCVRRGQAYLAPMTGVFILKIPRSISTYDRDGSVEKAVGALASSRPSPSQAHPRPHADAQRGPQR